MFAADEIRRSMTELGNLMAGVLEERADLKAKLDTANALVTCCCGSPVDSHGYGDGHSPVDQYHYAHMRLTERVEKLEAALKPFAQFISQVHPHWADERRIVTLNLDFSKMTIGVFRRAAEALK